MVRVGELLKAYAGKITASPSSIPASKRSAPAELGLSSVRTEDPMTREEAGQAVESKLYLVLYGAVPITIAALCFEKAPNGT